MIKKNIYILFFLYSMLLPDKNTENINNNIQVNKNQHSTLFKQARVLEKNGLFNEAKLVYENILFEDPSNKIAFNKIKVILKNEENFKLLKDIAEKYQLAQPNNPMAKIDLLEVYLISSDERWEIIANEIFNENKKNDFLIKSLINIILKLSDNILFSDNLIQKKRQQHDKQEFYSFEIGNYYISKLNYEEALVEFLIFLDKNPNQYDKISAKILSIPDYEGIQEKIELILDASPLHCSKMLLSDLAFKRKKFQHSYDILKDNLKDPQQLLNFAYQNKKIKNYNLAIEVCQYLIGQDYNSKTTILAILEMGDVLEEKSIKSKFELPISQYFYNNQILKSPYYYVESKNLKILDKAIVLYDSLYSISKGSNAGFRLAEIRFSILNDLDKALDIYNDCINYSNNNSIKFNSTLRMIDIMIAKGNLVEAKKILVKNMNKYNTEKQNNLLAIKNIQINFLNMEESIMDSISNAVLRIPKNNFLYNDLLDIQTILLAFKDESELLEQFSKVQLLIFQNKRTQAINRLTDMYENSKNNTILNDFIIHQLSYLLLLNDNPENALSYLDHVSHETIFSEFSYILKAEIFDYIINDKKNAVDLYLDFLNKYPLSIFYDDIRIRLRNLASS